MSNGNETSENVGGGAGNGQSESPSTPETRPGGSTTPDRRPRFDAAKAARELPVVLAFAIIGFIGSVVLFLFTLPAILVAVFLATGVASLVYGFLGGITAAKFNLGPLQVTGSLAALLGCAWFVNAELVEQMNARPVFEGYFNDVRAQPVQPLRVGEPAMVVQTIEPENPQVKFAQWEERWDIENNTKQVGWLLIPQRGTSAVVLKFQHRFEAWTKMNTLPPGLPSSARTNSACGAVSGYFVKRCGTESKTIVLKLTELRRRAATRLVYQAHETDPDRKIGQLFLREPDGSRVKLEWEVAPTATELAVASSVVLPGSHWLSVAYAAPEAAQEIFRPDGQYDEKVGRALRQQLGQTGLKVQAYARNVVVRNGRRSLTFIEESIEASRNEEGYDRPTLLHNLSVALEGIERPGVVVPDKLQLKMANALYEIGDFEGAAAAYAKVPDEVGGDPDLLLRKAYSWYAIAEYEQGANRYKAYLARAETPEAQAVAHANLAGLYMESGELDQAIQHFESAIAAQPESPNPYYNNLAYLYAEQGVELQRALELANRAAEMAPDEPNSLDTKGWVLYKMGDLEAALENLERAAELAPNNPEITSHLQTVRREIR